MMVGPGRARLRENAINNMMGSLAAQANATAPSFPLPPPPPPPPSSPPSVSPSTLGSSTTSASTNDFGSSGSSITSFGSAVPSSLSDAQASVVGMGDPMDLTADYEGFGLCGSFEAAIYYQQMVFPALLSAGLTPEPPLWAFVATSENFLSSFFYHWVMERTPTQSHQLLLELAFAAANTGVSPWVLFRHHEEFLRQQAEQQLPVSAPPPSPSPKALAAGNSMQSFFDLAREK